MLLLLFLRSHDMKNIADLIFIANPWLAQGSFSHIAQKPALLSNVHADQMACNWPLNRSYLCAYRNVLKVATVSTSTTYSGSSFHICIDL